MKKGERLNFEDFQANLIKENKKLRLFIGFSTILFVLLLSVVLMDQRYFIYRGHPIFEERILSEKICMEGFRSIATGEPDENTVTGGVVEILKKDPFLIEINKVLVLKSIDTNFCKVVVDSKGLLRAFRIGLDGKDSNPFFYKILTITELAVEEEV